MAVCSVASRGTSGVGSNVTFMLLIPHLKVEMQCVSAKVVLNGGILSLSASQPLGKYSLKAISELLGIVFHLDVLGVLEIWRPI